MTERTLLVLGTRGSALALAQTVLVRAALGDRATATREIKTTGDRRQDLSLTAVGGDGHGYVTGGERIDPGLFTRELESALLAGEIDVAVHSLKDLPTVMPAGLVLAAVLPRADTADVLVLKDAASLADLPAGATLATSSLRRQFQLQHHRPDLRVSEVRGNVPTRLGKLRTRDDWAGLVLARAGLERLGHAAGVRAGRLDAGEHGPFTVETLAPGVMLPAVGQGAIGLQCRADDARTRRALAAVNHLPTWTAVTAERALLALLGGGCQMPLGVGTQLLGGQLWLRAILFTAAGAKPLRAEASGPAGDPGAVAATVAARLRVQGTADGAGAAD